MAAALLPARPRSEQAGVEVPEEPEPVVLVLEDDPIAKALE
jgi:hypothetical protein